MAIRVKVYVVQQADGTILTAKLTREAAQAVAKQYAPCRVVLCMADKTPKLSVQDTDQRQ